MKAADYTLPFYRKCLSQHIWDWRSRFVTTHVAAHHEHNEERLKQVAHELGGGFIQTFNEHSAQPILPFAGLPAAETTPPNTHTNTPMKLEITIPDELFNPLVQAIDRLTAVMERHANPTVTITTDSAGGSITTSTEASAGDPVVINTTPEPEKPKATRTKKTKELEPEVTPTPAVEEAPVVVEAEATLVVEEAPTKVKVPTGPELSEKVGPLAKYPDLQAEIIRYKANELKINGPIRLVTDTEQLAKFNAKLDELLAQIPSEV